MENWIVTSRQTFEEKLDNPHQRFKFHSSLIFGFTGVSVPYFEPIFPTFIYLSTLLPSPLWRFNTGPSGLRCGASLRREPHAHAAGGTYIASIITKRTSKKNPTKTLPVTINTALKNLGNSKRLALASSFCLVSSSTTEERVI